VKRLIETPAQLSNLNRRELLLKTVFGAGFLGLQSLATGLPIAFLANPRKALAANPSGPPAACSTNPNAQYLILSTSGQGDPVNTNAPGTYEDPKIGHPADPSMKATSMTVGTTQTTAAAPWAALPQAMLNQTCFFHHGTYTLIHADEPNVMSVMGDVSQNEMLVSMIAKQMATCLGTIQQQPITLGGTGITFGGQPLPVLPPTSLSTMLASPTGPLGQLTAMRDQTLDAVHALVKAAGNSAQQAFITNYATSRDQVRHLSQSLIGQLSAISDNSEASQLQAALILIQMNVAPVMVVGLDFGADNHTDQNLANETANTVSTLATLGTFWQQLQTMGLGSQVSIASLNVFGRTMDASTSIDGRGHNPNHHVMFMTGQPFAGSIIGGVEPDSNQPGQSAAQGGADYTAMSIDMNTGVGVPSGGGNIPFNETFQSAAKTLAAGIGVSQTAVSQNITGGSVINAALANG
jgi:hypothetical protein